MLPSALPKKLGSGRLLWHSWEISSPTPFRAQKEGAAWWSHADSMGCYGAMQTHADSCRLHVKPDPRIPDPRGNNCRSSDQLQCQHQCLWEVQPMDHLLRSFEARHRCQVTQVLMLGVGWFIAWPFSWCAKIWCAKVRWPTVSHGWRYRMIVMIDDDRWR